MPNVPEDYVHRIGRTGRAGNEGEAISLVCVDEIGLLRDIERLLNTDIPKVVLDGYEPDPSIRAEPIQLIDHGRGHIGIGLDQHHFQVVSLRNSDELGCRAAARMYQHTLHRSDEVGFGVTGAVRNHNRPHLAQDTGDPWAGQLRRKAPAQQRPIAPLC